MKINDVLECINNVLVDDRHNQGLDPMLGHFVYHVEVHKNIGPIKTFHASIEFVSIKNKEVIPVIRIQHTTSCSPDNIEEAKDQAAKTALTSLFKVLKHGKGKLDYQNFVTGEYKALELNDIVE